MTDPVVLGPDEGEVVRARGNAMWFKAVAATARLLVLHAPAMDDYFRELEALWASGEPPDHAEELDLMRRHGMEPV
jgi:hypothetical protein